MIVFLPRAKNFVHLKLRRWEKKIFCSYIFSFEFKRPSPHSHKHVRSTKYEKKKSANNTCSKINRNCKSRN